MKHQTYYPSIESFNRAPSITAKDYILAIAIGAVLGYLLTSI